MSSTPTPPVLNTLQQERARLLKQRLDMRMKQHGQVTPVPAPVVVSPPAVIAPPAVIQTIPAPQASARIFTGRAGASAPAVNNSSSTVPPMVPTTVSNNQLQNAIQNMMNSHSSNINALQNNMQSHFEYMAKIMAGVVGKLAELEQAVVNGNGSNSNSSNDGNMITNLFKSKGDKKNKGKKAAVVETPVVVVDANAAPAPAVVVPANTTSDANVAPAVVAPTQ